MMSTLNFCTFATMPAVFSFDMIKSKGVPTCQATKAHVRILTAASSLFALMSMGGTSVAQSSSFKDDVFPVLSDRCFRCHGDEQQNGDVRLDTLSTDLVGDSAAAEIWHDVLGAINRGEMPPEDEPQPYRCATPRAGELADPRD